LLERVYSIGMSKSVAHIFGGEAKVKVMRLFVFNKGAIFTAKTVCEKAQANPKIVRKELNILTKAGLLKRRAKGYVLDNEYKYLPAIEHFLLEASAVTDKEIVKKLSRAGKLSLILTSGVFKHDPEARVDLLVVGDKLKQGRLLNAISSIEAQIGRELRYAAFETPDFKYRLGVYDKLIRDILDYPHHKIIDKVGLQTEL
jgi:hypothetical protein